MIAGKKVLAVVPARGGSKGIPLKNLRKVAGLPLVAHVGKVIQQLDFIDRAVVTTDHEEIAAVAEAAGISAPFRRPEHLSGDRIGDLEVLTHALQETERHDDTAFDIIVMLQPTSPLRTAADVKVTIEKLVGEDLDAAWTVTETDSKAHPFKQLIVDNGMLRLFDARGASVVARQQLLSVYHRNGVAYALTRDCLLRQKTVLGARTGAVILPGQHISIDSEWDIELVEFIMSRRRRSSRTDKISGQGKAPFNYRT